MTDMATLDAQLDKLQQRAYNGGNDLMALTIETFRDALIHIGNRLSVLEPTQQDGEPTDDDLRVDAGSAYCADESIGANTHPCTSYGAGYIAGYRAREKRVTTAGGAEAGLISRAGVIRNLNRMAEEAYGSGDTQEAEVLRDAAACFEEVKAEGGADHG